MLALKLLFSAPEQIQTPALATWAFEPPHLLEGDLARLDQKTGGRLKELVAAGEFSGKAGETLLLHYPPGLEARRLLLLGAGKRDSTPPDRFRASEVRNLAGAAARFLKARGVTEFVLWIREPARGPETAQAAVEGVGLANFEPGRYRSSPSDGKERGEVSITGLGLAGFDPSEAGALEAAVSRGEWIGEAQNFARELVNEPSNRLTPRVFAERTAAMAEARGLEVEILDENRIRALHMGALLSVTQGSEEPPRVVVLTYTPPGWKKGEPVLGLVGKGITFDSGGISIKPSEGMEKMKYDMAGAATMAGVLEAVGRLRPRTKVIAVLPLAENLPSGKAQKPGDVQVAMSGKTIEVVNTDAEGRLVLADALHYARQLGATHLVDAATLTGAVVVALGHVNAGAFTNNQEFLDRFLRSAQAVGEKFWLLPLDEEYRDNIKSSIADIRNTGKNRGGGAINGAFFLREFVEDTPWIHLDIAGTAWLEEAKPWMVKGPSGIAVRTLIHFVEAFRS